ncbi:MAG: hypothetical protein J1F09_04550 [Oscillospiraceae bacterium]|nr:hypothetical protein [Oscillospiraceae bacterium]
MLKIRILLTFVLLAVMGIIFFGVGVRDKVEMSKPRGIIEDMHAEDFYDGQFVEGNIYELWDEFAYRTEDSQVKARYFALPLETSFYEDEWTIVAVSFSNSFQMATAQRMAKESDNYYRYGKEPVSWTEMHIEGKVTKLKGEQLKFFKEYVIDELELSTDNMCAYVINASNNGSGSGAMLVIGIIFAVIGLGGLAFMIVRRVLTGRF